VALPSADIFLPARGRFDLRATVVSYGYYQLPPCRWEDGRRPVLRRAERLPSGRVYLLECRPARNGVMLRATGVDAGEAEILVPLAARVRTALRLDEDLTEFHRLCRREPALRPIARGGLGRLLRGTSLFEDLVKAIAWTNTTWPAAVATIGRLGALGRRCPADPSLRAFPTAAEIASAGVRVLRAAGLGYRAEYLVRLARETLDGRRDLDALAARAVTLPVDEVARALRSIRGVGPATTAYVLMMLGYYDRPAIDRATLRWAAGALYRGHAPTTARLERRIARYGRWRGLVLWFSQWLGSRARA